MTLRLIVRFLSILLFLLLFSLKSYPQQETRLYKALVDDDSKFTNIGNIELTITNFGTLGHGFAISGQPSCEFPKGSSIEHLFDGGLWVGGIKAGEKLVTTGAVDASSVVNVLQGFEFTNSADPTDVVVERSTLLDSKFFSLDAVSHQDFIADYTDRNTFVPETGDRIPEHKPLGIDVHQETYAWALTFANAFVILNYEITNASDEPIENMYVGLWVDTMVGNTQLTPNMGPNRTWNFRDDGNSYVDSLRLAYEYDFDGESGFAESYIGVKLLGSIPFPEGDSARAIFNMWQFRNNEDPIFFSPTTDDQRYDKLSRGFNTRPDLSDPNSPTYWRNLEGSIGPNNRTMLLSTGPFRTVNPGETINVVFAIVTAKKFGSDPMEDDTEQSKKNLFLNSFWAQTAFNGEDRNQNNRLDEGEDLTENGRLDRYILPASPPPPRFKIIPGNQKVTLLWNDRPEDFVDPLSGEQDFEGYRLYRTQLGADLGIGDLLSTFSLIADFDRDDDDIGLNTGFDFIRLQEPIFFEDEIETRADPETGATFQDTTFYVYKFENRNLHNGWQYAFAITAYDAGDPINNLESLESDPLLTSTRVFPGTPAVPIEEKKTEREKRIGVFPNPYRAGAVWDGRLERERKIYFYNLPRDCIIRIFTLAGNKVDDIEHHAATYQGNDIQWFGQFAEGNRIFAGGIHAWDTVTKDDQALATG
ncbi:hypothetical protein GWN42_32045, partial [candidate division KSB1 bacterium]|nr:hypothetical protein [candidate division KSB1 bacterium]NIS28345.1 hypothetical protein [candidate division KSB1 bacterium]NIU29077.1 hypothetical protein [candidate division KSB1 bacterium]NIU93597.1 hypothetical protein [candidate division KSB1 bacterium]NIV97299.1 hypothetical protein [candidate division KSB1 bacterium]